MKKSVNIFLSVFLSVAVMSCGSGGGGGKTGGNDSGKAYRSFEKPQVPTVYGDMESAAQYLSVHFWDKFFSGTGISDTSAVLGVKIPELEKAFADYTGLLDYVPMDDAQAGITTLFNKVCEVQKSDTTSHIYTVFAQIVEKYLYDPNSPLRNEDYFLPYVKALSTSELSSDDLRPSYEYQAGMCSLNRFGTQVPDFGFCTPDGRKTRLYSVKAENTALFFSNPGCHACKEIIDALKAIPGVETYVAGGKLAVVNIYIDEELDKWREYLPNYPDYWICGYDYRYIIRKDVLYNVRAIPSLYLLDAEKRVVLKDAPTEKLINTLNQRLCQ